MIRQIEKRKATFSYKFLSLLISIAFSSSLIVSPSLVLAQSELNLPAPGTLIAPSSAVIPAYLAGITINPNNALQFDFLVDTGEKQLSQDALNQETMKLVKYFLTALTIPDEELWVNLSPYQAEKIVPTGLGQTEMGKDLLAQDYILKQLTASLMYPEQRVGQNFWDREYARAFELYGTTDIPVNTFNKVWVIPDRAVVYENGESATAFIVDSHLKVMLEEDYMAINKNLQDIVGVETDKSVKDLKDISNFSSQIIREVILPEIEREVNEGENFSSLRQIFSAMILATWYKKSLKESLLGKIYADQNKTAGVETQDKLAKEKIYEQYLEAFKRGAYDLTKEVFDPNTKEFIPRRYFSGGILYQPEIVKTITIPSIPGQTQPLVAPGELRVPEEVRQGIANIVGDQSLLRRLTRVQIGITGIEAPRMAGDLQLPPPSRGYMVLSEPTFPE